ncbi:MAG: phage major tail tube protein [Pseudodesulfovibrio sp.]|uniref:phage major tail tube protein n=1 Tax=Pseudodesulfovibrio sp. TaxID=2035812 RepID=UPI003D0F673C
MAEYTPEKLVAFRGYKDGTTLVGIVDMEFSGGEFESDEMSGAGISGTIESPTIGHVKPMTAKVKWRMRTSQSTELDAPTAHNLELRASQQVRDSAGALSTQPIRVVVQVVPKGGIGTKFEQGKPQDCDAEFAVHYYKEEINGVETKEIDPLNNKYVVNGTDYLAGVRSDIGMES